MNIQLAWSTQQAVDASPVQAESEFPEGGLRRVEHKGTPILLAKRDRRILPLAETCRRQPCVCQPDQVRKHRGGVSCGAFRSRSSQCLRFVST